MPAWTAGGAELPPPCSLMLLMLTLVATVSLAVADTARGLLLLAGVEPNPGPSFPAPPAKRRQVIGKGPTGEVACPRCAEVFGALWLLVEHVNRDHAGQAGGDQTLAEAVRTAGGRVCGRCGTAVIMAQRCGRCAIGALSSAPAATPAGDAALLRVVEEELARRRPTLRHVPGAAREAVAAEYTALILRACVARDAAAIGRLLLFPRTVLEAPAPRQLRARGLDLAGLVRDRLRAWQAEPDATAQGVVPTGGAGQVVSRRSRRKQAAKSELLPAKLIQLASEGYLAKAARGLCPAPLHDPEDPAVIARLKELHPPGVAAPPRPPSAAGLAAFTEDEVVRAIRHLARSDAHGPDGLRATHLLELAVTAGGGTRRRLVAAVAKLCSLAAEGALPCEWARTFCASSLTALQKRGGGVRPIAVATALGRLTSSLALLRVGAGGVDWEGLQFGAGIPGGADAVVHCTRWAAAQLEANPGLALLKIDLANAFNCISRAEVVTQAADCHPLLGTWGWWSLSAPSLLTTGGVALESAAGVRQGDPCSPLFFALGIQPVVKRLRDTHGCSLKCWFFLDDGVVLCPKSMVNATILELREGFKAIGLRLNADKCEVLTCAPEREQFAAPRTPVSQWEVLGSPIHPQAAEAVFAKRLQAVRDAVDVLPALGDAHTAFRLLSACVGTAKLQYILRTTPPTWLANLRDADDAIIAGLAPALGDLGADHIPGVFRPVRMGGLGLHRPGEAAPLWFAEGAAMAVEPLRAILGEPTALPVGLLEVLRMHPWIAERGQELFAQLAAQTAGPLQSFDRKARPLLGLLHEARLTTDGLSTREIELQRATAGVPVPWLTPPRPGHTPTHLAPPEFRALARFRIGAPVFEASPSSAAPTCGRCSQPCDRFGDHAVACKYGGARNGRHYALRDALLFLLQVAGAGSLRTEVPVPPSAVNAAELRPADIFIGSWLGRPLALDVTCVHPLAPSNAGAAASSATARAEKRKVDKYSARCAAAGWAFRPFAYSAFGVPGPAAAAFTKDVATRISTRLGCAPNEAAGYCAAVLGMAVAHGVADQLVSHQPPPTLAAFPDVEQADPPVAGLVDPTGAGASDADFGPAGGESSAHSPQMDTDAPDDAHLPQLQPFATVEPRAARSSPSQAAAAVASAAASALSTSFTAARAVFAGSTR